LLDWNCEELSVQALKSGAPRTARASFLEAVAVPQPSVGYHTATRSGRTKGQDQDLKDPRAAKANDGRPRRPNLLEGDRRRVGRGRDFPAFGWPVLLDIARV